MVQEIQDSHQSMADRRTDGKTANNANNNMSPYSKRRGHMIITKTLFSVFIFTWVFSLLTVIFYHSHLLMKIVRYLTPSFSMPDFSFVFKMCYHGISARKCPSQSSSVWSCSSYRLFGFNFVAVHTPNDNKRLKVY